MIKPLFLLQRDLIRNWFGICVLCIRGCLMV